MFGAAAALIRGKGKLSPLATENVVAVTKGLYSSVLRLEAVQNQTDAAQCHTENRVGF